MKKALVLLTTVLATSTVFALQQEAESDKATMLKLLDKDKDGTINIEEAMKEPVLLASFGKIDADGDGKITLTELTDSPLDLSTRKG